MGLLHDGVERRFQDPVKQGLPPLPASQGQTLQVEVGRSQPSVETSKPQSEDISCFLAGKKRTLEGFEKQWMEEMRQRKAEWERYSRRPKRCSTCRHLIEAFKDEHQPHVERGDAPTISHAGTRSCRVPSEERSPNVRFGPSTPVNRQERTPDGRLPGCPCERCHRAFPFLPLLRVQKDIRAGWGMTPSYGEKYLNLLEGAS